LLNFVNISIDNHTCIVGGNQIPLKNLKGNPMTFNAKSFVEDLLKLKSNMNEIFLPVYDRNLHDPVHGSLRIKDESFVIIEGMFLLYNEMEFRKVKEILNITIFIDTNIEECHKRLINRRLLAGRS
jgi:pantothenate kinase